MGGPKETNTVSKFEPPDWTASEFPGYVQTGKNIAQRWLNGDQSLVYGNQGEAFVAPMVADQINAFHGIQNLTGGLWRDGAAQQARQGRYQNTLMDALGGGLTQGPSAANAYMGDRNPHLDRVIAKNTEDMSKAYATGTAAQRIGGASRARALGGTAEAELSEMQNSQFMDNVGDMANNARMQAYQQSAAMDEARINRDWQAKEQGFGRQMQGLGAATGQQQADLQALQAYMGFGEMSRGLDQQHIDARRNLFYQNQQIPLIGLDLLGSILTRGSGGAGTNTSQMFGGYNPWATGAGLATAGAGLFNAFGGG